MTIAAQPHPTLTPITFAIVATMPSVFTVMVCPAGA